MSRLLIFILGIALYFGCAAKKEVKPEEPQKAPTAAPAPAPQQEEVTPAPAPAPEIKLESIYFDFDKSIIKKEAAEVLKKNAEAIKGASGIKVRVEGNCDERGTNEYNMALGERRANAAVEYLVNLGIDKTILRAVSNGEEKPVCTEHNESCWSKNRRVDFVVEK